VTAYLTLAEFKARSLMPQSDVEALETAASGWVDGQLEYYSRAIDARLRKRYSAPFAAPVPEAVREWLTRIVTVRCFLRRGVDPADPQFAAIADDATEARAEIKEAADSVEGLFDLPILDTADASGVSKGGPLSYTEASPYVWTDKQVDTGRDEDSNGEGTYGS